MKERRYYTTFIKPIYARNDNEAKVLAAKFAKETGSVVTELTEQLFGTLQSRVVHSGSLTIFENHIIETT